MRNWLMTLILTGIAATAANAQDVRIRPGLVKVETVIRGKKVVIERNQDQNHRLAGGFTKTSRACPPFCIHPMEAAPGVATVGEIEVMQFLQTTASDGKGLLIDARIPDFYKVGTIPGAVNVPFSTVDEKNYYRDDILSALGAVSTDNGWNFDAAQELLVFCNGPWCDQSPTMIRNLLKVGYPAEKLYYYRGGMQNWLMLGLSVEVPAGTG